MRSKHDNRHPKEIPAKEKVDKRSTNEIMGKLQDGRK
jgi:hypothetical protein